MITCNCHSTFPRNSVSDPDLQRATHSPLDTGAAQQQPQALQPFATPLPPTHPYPGLITSSHTAAVAALAFQASLQCLEVEVVRSRGPAR